MIIKPGDMEVSYTQLRKIKENLKFRNDTQEPETKHPVIYLNK